MHDVVDRMFGKDCLKLTLALNVIATLDHKLTVVKVRLEGLHSRFSVSSSSTNDGMTSLESRAYNLAANEPSRSCDECSRHGERVDEVFEVLKSKPALLI